MIESIGNLRNNMMVFSEESVIIKLYLKVEEWLNDRCWDCCISAACALLALVVFVIVKVSPILSRLNKTVDNVNHSLEVITKDVDSLSIEVEGY